MPVWCLSSCFGLSPKVKDKDRQSSSKCFTHRETKSLRPYRGNEPGCDIVELAQFSNTVAVIFAVDPDTRMVEGWVKLPNDNQINVPAGLLCQVVYRSPAPLLYPIPPSTPSVRRSVRGCWRRGGKSLKVMGLDHDPRFEIGPHFGNSEYGYLPKKQ